VLRVRDDVLVLQTRRWPDEIRNPDFGSLRDVEPAKPNELKMAQLLLDTLAGDYDPGEFEDDYAAAVHDLVEAKLQGGEVKRTKEPAPSGGEVVDLLAALQKSVAAAKTARGEDAGDVEEAADAEPEESKESKESGSKPAKKSTGKKSDAKKTAKKSESKKKPAAKKSTAKKSTAKKSAAKKSA
jgi:DNA end-binding protein Ku